MSHRSSLSGPNWRVFIACLHQYVLAVSLAEEKAELRLLPAMQCNALAHAKEENSRVELQQATTAITTVVEKGALEK
jgi:hypothetical protein